MSKFAYVHNIQSHVKQEVDMPQNQKCVSGYSSPYWCSMPNSRKLASVVPEIKCDRNYLVSKFAYVHNIQSHVKQEVDMLQIQKCVTRYSSPYRCSVPNIRKLEGGSRGKCDRNFLWRWWRKTMDSDPYLSPPLKPAGDTKTDILMKYVTPYHSIIF